MFPGEAAETVGYSGSPVNPKTAYHKVFIFNISEGLRLHGSAYEATRKAWRYSPLMKSGGVAVGLERGISRGVYVFADWEKSPDNRPGGLQRYVFHTNNRYDTQSGRDHELLNKDWRKITGMTGYFNFGGYLVVEFDGRGRFRFLFGYRDKQNWYPLE